MKVHFRIATAAAFGGRGALGAKTFQGGPSLNQRAVHGEMLVRQQLDKAYDTRGFVQAMRGLFSE